MSIKMYGIPSCTEEDGRSQEISILEQAAFAIETRGAQHSIATSVLQR
jgi:hypothetical protein